MFYEKEVKTLDDLMKAVRVLDEDSGIRLVGALGRRKCLVFVTRFGQRFTMMTYGMRARTGAPGSRLGAREFDDVEALVEALRRVVPRRIRAYVY